MTTWKCINGCGACCHLDPQERPDLADYLSPKELEQYLTLVGPDGWCLNYDPQTRECRIYEQRPRFCRVQSDIFAQMYQIDAADFQEFAIACCHQQITGVYGPSSPERQRYCQEVSGWDSPDEDL